MDVQNTTALVTGANRGLGHALVRALLVAGARRVYATARVPYTLEATRALDPARVVPLALDVTSRGQIEQAAAAAPDARLVINNAATLDFAGPLALSATALRHHMEVNFHGLVEVSQRFGTVNAAQGGGALVNILSLVALRNAPAMAAYAASKAAAWAMTQSLRAELQQRDVAVHAVFPGPVDTDMLRSMTIAKSSPEAVAVEIVAGLQGGRPNIFPDPLSRSWAGVA